MFKGCRPMIRIKLNEILLILRDNRNNLDVESHAKFEFQQCQTVRDLQILNESLLDSNDRQKQFDTKIANLGGKSLQKSVAHAMITVMTDNVGAEVTWAGLKKDTVAISKLKIGELIISGIMLNKPQASENNVQEHMKDWIRRSSQRVAAAKKRLENKNNPTNLVRD
ncbi:uncharacterized protein LOC122857600 isoform X1 [Aphidius gifuensis]|nr:uncharacterized protein LOC122857600 isoform X1 [Aphidius gifuensis]